MNVPGMPWYAENTATRANGEGTPRHTDAEELHGKDLWRFIRSAVAAAMVVAGVLIAGMVVFTLFCTEIGLR